MTGWRIGYAAGDKEIIKKMKTLQSQSTSCASSISQAAASTALNNTCNELPEMNKEYKKRHDFVVSELNKIEGVECKPTDGTFYVFPSFKDYLNKNKILSNDTELALYILEKAKVAVVPGSAFGIDNHIRISIAIDMDSLKEAMKRLNASLNL
jgi:aspartate aminotransferase